MIKLYSTGCPQCNILESKLHAGGINFEISTDVEKLIELGFTMAPVLQVEDNYLTFAEAIKWLKEGQ